MKRVLSEDEKAELLRDFRQAKYQDKHTIEVLSHLYGVSVEEVKEIMANERNKAFQWTDERVHRLKAYIAQGTIANELGCKVQCVADYKRTHKSELGWLGKKKEVGKEISEQSKKKEPSTVGAAESSEKKIDITKVNSSINDYNTKAQECQEVSEDTLWSARYMELSKAQGEALSRLYECEAFLTAASDAGRLWGCVTNTEKLQNYVEMYRVLCERALECCCAAVETLEKE